MPQVCSNLVMNTSRVRGLQAPLNTDEPARKADIVGTNRIYRNSTISGAVTIDWDLFDEVRFTIVGNTVLTFINGADGQGYVLKLKQGGSGGYTVTFPASVRYSIDMLTYSVTSSVGAVDRLGFMVDADDSKYDFVSAVRNLV